MISNKLSAFYGLMEAAVTNNLVPVVVFLSAACVASLAGIGVTIYRLDHVEQQLHEMQQQRVDDRVLRLDIQLDPKGVEPPKAEVRPMEVPKAVIRAIED